METNKLSGPTRRTLCLHDFLAPPPSLPTEAPAVTVAGRNNRVTAIYSTPPPPPGSITGAESSRIALIFRFARLNLRDLHHVMTPHSPELILLPPGSGTFLDLSADICSRSPYYRWQMTLNFTLYMDVSDDLLLVAPEGDSRCLR